MSRALCKSLTVMAAAGNNDTWTRCSGFEVGWWPYIAVSGSVYALGLILILIIVCSHRVFERTVAIHNQVTILVRRTGKALFIIALTGNVTYYILTLYRAGYPVYICSEHTTLLILESIINSILLVIFIFSILSAKRPLLHWFHPFVIIDCLTLFHPFVSLSLSYDWLGLRTIRFLWLIKAAKLLIMFNRTSSSDIVQVGNVVCTFMGIWLTASGLIQLLESTGDPWDQQNIASNLTYWSSAYFVIVTISTVGYGDITLTTVCGRIFLTVFIIIGVVVTAIVLPSVLDIVVFYHHTLQYKHLYTMTHDTRLVLVCGYVTAYSAECFLKELLHSDKQDNTTYIVFLNPVSPSNELRQVLKNYFARVQYFIGSPLSTSDLCKCGLYSASTVIVLADRHCCNPVEEDRANLMRVVAIKTTCNTVPVILQLLSHLSKDMLGSIPGWNSSKDRVICLNELKMKILAQTCLIRGFCTFISNLFFATGSSQVKKRRGLPQSSWQQLYISGACKKIYSTKFSKYFFGMRINEAAILCHEKLNVTLLAVLDTSSERIILEESTGYVMADCLQDVYSIQYYCNKCHTNIVLPLNTCYCRPDYTLSYESMSNQHSTPTITTTPVAMTTTPNITMTTAVSSNLFETPPSDETDNRFILPPTHLIGHIVVCLFAAADLTTIGFTSFLSPLRASCIPIVVVTNFAYFKREWSTLSNQTHVYCIPGNPLDWTCLQRAGIEQSRTSIILSAHTLLKDYR